MSVEIVGRDARASTTFDNQRGLSTLGVVCEVRSREKWFEGIPDIGSSCRAGEPLRLLALLGPIIVEQGIVAGNRQVAAGVKIKKRVGVLKRQFEQTMS